MQKKYADWTIWGITPGFSRALQSHEWQEKNAKIVTFFCREPSKAFSQSWKNFLHCDPKIFVWFPKFFYILSLNFCLTIKSPTYTNGRRSILAWTTVQNWPSKCRKFWERANVLDLVCRHFGQTCRLVTFLRECTQIDRKLQTFLGWGVKTRAVRCKNTWLPPSGMPMLLN